MAGKLFYLMGASGSGKDSLLQGCRQRLQPEQKTCVAHRYITRAADAGGENHVHLSSDEFELRKHASLFAMHWASHGHLYGIGIEVENWLASGFNVIINGSREYLPIAMERYPSLVPILIQVEQELLRNRLINRKRESIADIEQRLARHQTLLKTMPSGTLLVDNSQSLDEGITALQHIISPASLASAVQ